MDRRHPKLSAPQGKKAAKRRDRSAHLGMVIAFFRWTRRFIVFVLFVVAIALLVLDVWGHFDHRPLSLRRFRWTIGPGKVEPDRITTEFQVAAFAKGDLIFDCNEIWNSGRAMYDNWENATRSPGWHCAFEREVSWGDDQFWPSHLHLIRSYSKHASNRSFGYNVRAIAIPCLLVAAAVGIWPLVSIGLWTMLRLRRRRWRASNRCPECGYDLRGGNEGCPECGWGRLTN
jgi:hypothetical protein